MTASLPPSRHYLDHASTSPARPEVVEAMLPWLSAADPARVHTEGRMARVAIEDARGSVATLLGSRPREVVFTSSATEAINAAVWGATRANPDGEVVCAAVEHSAVRDASARHRGRVTGVDGWGRIDVDALLHGVARDTTALVHCQWGNHEVGTIQPVEEIVAACRERGVLVHVDAAQAAGHVAIDFASLGADLLSVSAHKFGGPQGAGALLVRRGLRLEPLLVGGEQERARRAGMENVAAIVGFGAAAATLGSGDRLAAEEHVARGQTARVADSVAGMAGVHRYGAADDRLPHLVCFGVEGIEAEPVLLALDQQGIAVHSGSACASESLEPSPVLEAMGVDAERSIRVSVGWSTTDDDIASALEALPLAVERLRALRS